MLRTVAAFDRIGEENAFAVLARATQLAAQGRDVINLGIGQPDFRTPEFIVEAAVKALRDGHHGYTPTNGIPPLREAVAADLHRRFGVTVSPGEVMVMPGGKPVMFMAILMFGEAGADILYPDPGFPIYRSMIEYTGARPIPVPVREANGFAFSAEETLKLITPQTRLLIVNSPANPTGGVTPKAEVDKLVAGLARHPDVAVMSDEIYDQLVYDGERHVCLLSYPDIRDRLILLNGWSKTYAMTGWRLGYAVWPGKLYDYARKLAVNLHSCVNAPTQYAGLAALREANELKREASLLSSEWTAHEEARCKTVARLEIVENHLAAIQAEKRRLERQKEAFPLLSRRRRNHCCCPQSRRSRCCCCCYCSCRRCLGSRSRCRGRCCRTASYNPIGRRQGNRRGCCCCRCCRTCSSPTRPRPRRTGQRERTARPDPLRSW